MQLILLRHGEPARDSHASQNGKPVDPPLTEKGHAQANALATTLADESLDVLVMSPLLRARETAAPSEARLDLAAATLPGVAEVDGNGAGYVHVEDLRRKGGEAWAAFLRDPVGALGGNEAEFRSRVLDALASIMTTHKGAERVGVFTHGFPINVILAHILGIDSMLRFMPAHASITRVVGSTPDRMAVISVNETGHLASLSKPGAH